MMKIVLRVIAGIILLATLVSFNWWVVAIIAGICALIFDDYFEALIGGIMFDSISNMESASLFDFQFMLTLIIALLLVCTYFAKQMMRLHRVV